MADVKYADGTVAVTPENRVGAGDLGEWNLVFTGRGGCPLGTATADGDDVGDAGWRYGRRGKSRPLERPNSAGIRL